MSCPHPPETQIPPRPKAIKHYDNNIYTATANFKKGQTLQKSSDSSDKGST